MPALVGALLIFCLRIGDVSFGTLRVMFMVRQERLLAAFTAVGEATVYLLAIATVLKGDLTPIRVVGYASGYAAGTAVGMWLEEWMAIGSVMVRIISPMRGPQLREILLAAGFGVTTVRGEGRDGEVLILFAVARRRRADELLALVRQIDPDAFITIEPVAEAIGGHLPIAQKAAAVEK